MHRRRASVIQSLFTRHTPLRLRYSSRRERERERVAGEDLPLAFPPRSSAFLAHAHSSRGSPDESVGIAIAGSRDRGAGAWPGILPLARSGFDFTLERESTCVWPLLDRPIERRSRAESSSSVVTALADNDITSARRNEPRRRSRHASSPLDDRREDMILH